MWLACALAAWRQFPDHGVFANWRTAKHLGPIDLSRFERTVQAFAAAESQALREE